MKRPVKKDNQFIELFNAIVACICRKYSEHIDRMLWRGTQ